MGTRGLIGFIIRGVRRGSYNHFDSYPTGLGVEIVRWILAHLTAEQREAMIARLEALTWVEDSVPPSEELQKQYQDAGFCNLEVSEQGPSDWYCLLHKTQGARCLQPIYDGTQKHIHDDTKFLVAGDTCEWAWFINFAAGTLEISSHGEEIATVPFDELSVEKMQKIEMEDRRRRGCID